MFSYFVEEKAKKFDDVEKELNEIKKANSGKEDFKTKYENEHTAFEKYKSEIAADNKCIALFELFYCRGVKASDVAVHIAGNINQNKYPPYDKKSFIFCKHLL